MINGLYTILEDSVTVYDEFFAPTLVLSFLFNFFTPAIL